MRKAPATAPEIHTNTAPVRDSAAGGQLLCICLYPWIKHNPAAPRATGVESHPQQLTLGTCRPGRRSVGCLPMTTAAAKTFIAARALNALGFAGLVGPCGC